MKGDGSMIRIIPLENSFKFAFGKALFQQLYRINSLRYKICLKVEFLLSEINLVVMDRGKCLKRLMMK